MGDSAITPELFDQAKRQQLERLRQQMGEQFRAGMLDTPEARESLVRNLMDEAAVSQMVAKEHVGVSEQEAVALIKNADALKENGKFSPALYERFLQSQGKSDQQFVAEVRRDLAKEALLTGVTATYPVPSAVVEHLHKIITEEREVQTLIFNIDQYMGDVKVTPRRSEGLLRRPSDRVHGRRTRHGPVRRALARKLQGFHQAQRRGCPQLLRTEQAALCHPPRSAARATF